VNKIFKRKGKEIFKEQKLKDFYWNLIKMIPILLSSDKSSGIAQNYVKKAK